MFFRMLTKGTYPVLSSIRILEPRKINFAKNKCRGVPQNPRFWVIARYNANFFYQKGLKGENYSFFVKENIFTNRYRECR